MNKPQVKTDQQGMTLIELMIALVLGLFLIGGVMQIFINSKQTYRMQDNISRLQENARFAMDFITRDIRMADYWGCLRGGLTNVTNNLDPGGAGYDAVIHGFAQGITGTNGVPDAANAALDAPDTIIMRGAIDSGMNVQAPFGPLASSNLQVTAGNTLTQGDVVLVADCTQADIFQVSNANPAAGVVVHNSGNATTPGNLNVANPGCPGANAHCLSKVYQGDAAIYQAQTITYTIQAGAGGRLSLFREFDSNGANELVEDIENMQILYGEDTNADNSPDYFVPAGTAGLNMDQVVSIRVWLLATSFDDNLTMQPNSFFFNGVNSPVPADRRLRRAFSSTFAVRNRLP